MAERRTVENDEPITRRAWLTIESMRRTGVPWWLAREAVSSVAMEHPDWDMDELRTIAEWAEGGA